MSEHKHDHDCQSGCDCGHDHSGEEMTVTLTLDDGTEMDCAVLSIFPVGEQQYIALVPTEDDGKEDEEGEIFLYRFNQLEDDELELLNIEDDDEYEAVADAFDELLDEQDFDDMTEDDEE